MGPGQERQDSGSPRRRHLLCAHAGPGSGQHPIDQRVGGPIHLSRLELQRLRAHATGLRPARAQRQQPAARSSAGVCHRQELHQSAHLFVGAHGGAGADRYDEIHGRLHLCQRRSRQPVRRPQRCGVRLSVEFRPGRDERHRPVDHARELGEIPLPRPDARAAEAVIATLPVSDELSALGRSGGRRQRARSLQLPLCRGQQFQTGLRLLRPYGAPPLQRLRSLAGAVGHRDIAADQLSFAATGLGGESRARQAATSSSAIRCGRTTASSRSISAPARTSS